MASKRADQNSIRLHSGEQRNRILGYFGRCHVCLFIFRRLHTK